MKRDIEDEEQMLSLCRNVTCLAVYFSAVAGTAASTLRTLLSSSPPLGRA